MEEINIFTTNFTRPLAERVIDFINKKQSVISDDLPIIRLGECKIEYFNNGEITCQYLKSIRNKRIYIFGHNGTKEFMELALMIDAAKRASASEIIVVIPCYGYGRQDKKEGIRGPIGARLMADFITVAGANRLITIDLHADAIQGFFNLPVDHINGYKVFQDRLSQYINEHSGNNFVVCSPDQGGFARASRFARKLELGGAIAINKERDKPGSVARMSMIGDVRDMNVILVDDMIDTGGTLCKAAEYLLEEKKVNSVVAVCTHPIFSSKAFENIWNSKLTKLFVSDTLPFEERMKSAMYGISKMGETYDSNKIEMVSSAPILTKMIGRIFTGKSVDEVNN